MKNYKILQSARNDISEIWGFTAERWGAEQADRYISGLQQMVIQFASGEVIARNCSKIYPTRGTILYFRYVKHFVFLREKLDVIEVLGVIHASSERMLKQFLSHY